MKNSYDIVCEIYNIWHPNIRPHISPALSFTFENELNNIKQYIQHDDYSRVLPIVQTMIKGFNLDDYKDKSWGKHAEKVFRDLKALEDTLLKLLT